MNMTRLILILLTALALAGCADSPTPTPTLTPVVTRTPTLRPTATPVPPTATPAPPTVPPQPPTPTPLPPIATLKLPANVRAGPSTFFPIIGKLKTGSRYPIVGKSEDSKWWQIPLDNKLGWIPADFTDVQGGTNLVVVVSVAPAPTATSFPTRPAPRGTVVLDATATPLPPAGGRVYFIIQGQAAWLRPANHNEIFQDATVGTPGDLNPNLYTNASPLDWSDTAGKLAYVQSGQQDTLRVHDQNTERVLDSHGAISSPRWFGGGLQIAYIGYDNGNQNQAIYVINADGAKPANYRCFPARSGEQLRGLAVNRRSGDIVVVSNFSGKFELWKLDRYCNNLVQLTHDSADDSGPAFSPDGTRIAYVSNRSAPTDYEIYLMNANGTGPMPLGPGFTPAFSPDGLYLAFARNLEVYIMDLNGNFVDPLTPGDRPTWAP
ncbi:MAG: SH3 domain-containing protein [Anaerolineae bacterium]